MLTINHIAKSFGEKQVLKDVSFELEKEKIYTLMGPNGAGKTTLFNIITGFLTADDGNIKFKGKTLESLKAHEINQLGIVRTFQDLRLINNLSVTQNIQLAFQKQIGERWWNVFFPKKYLNQQITLTEKTSSILKHTFIEDIANQKAGEISYGQQKLLTLACCLANNGELLLLDEPVAGINPNFREKTITLLKQLKSQGKTLLLIEHHTEFIEQISDGILFLNEGYITYFENYDIFKNDESVQKAYI